MEISHVTFPVEVLLSIILFASSLAYFMYLILIINIGYQSNPGFPGCFSIYCFIESVVFNTGDHGKGKHTCSGCFGP